MSLTTVDGKDLSTFDAKVKYFEEKQAELMKLDNELTNKANVYKAEMKAWCGITDGEKASIIELLKAVKKVTTPNA